MRVLKKISLSFVLFLTLVLIGSLAFRSVSALAETTSDELSVVGAQIRTTGNQGIRFVADIGAYDKTNVKSYGIAIAYGEVTVSEDFCLGGTVNGKTVLSAEMELLDDDVEGQYYVTLFGVPEEEYVQNVTARAYIVLNDDSVVYGSTVTVRSLVEVALKAKNDGVEADVIDASITYVGANYKKVYVNHLGDIVVYDSRFEYNVEKLAAEFLNDYTTVMEENIPSMTGFAAAVMGAYSPTFTEDQVKTSKVYTFFTKNNNEMYNKWSWLLNSLISISSNNSFLTAQVNIIAGTSTDWPSWYGARHLLSRIEGFLTRTRCTSTGFHSEYFADNTRDYYNHLINSTIYASDASNLYKVGDTYTLNNYIEPRLGYRWTGYVMNGTNYLPAQAYVITSNNVLFEIKDEAIAYAIKYMNGQNEITGLALSSYTVEDEVTLPNYQLEGHVFEGWYDNSDLSGEKITTIASGSTGEKVYYAKLTESSYVDVNVTFNLDGGSWSAEGLNEYGEGTLAVATYYNSIDWSGASIVFRSDAYVNNNWHAIGLAETDIPGVYTIITVGTGTVVNAYKTANPDVVKCTIIYHSDCTSEYKLVVQAIENAGNASIGKLVTIGELPETTGSGKSIDINFYNATEGTKTVSLVMNLPTPLTTPVKAGYTFLGWESSVDGTVITTYPGFTSNPGDVTYTAKWAAE